MNLTITYGWSEDNELSISYEATTDADTILNLTNHAYFNLNGHGSGTVLNHELRIDADSITELNKDQVPTGNYIPVDGTPFDFRRIKRDRKRYRSRKRTVKDRWNLRPQLCTERNRSARSSCFAVQRKRNPHDLFYRSAGTSALQRLLYPASEGQGRH